MKKFIVTATLAAAIAGPLAVADQAGAASLPKLAPIAGGQSLGEPVQYRNYCHRWRRECAHRWGWGGWRYRRCLSIRGCL